MVDKEPEELEIVSQREILELELELEELQRQEVEYVKLGLMKPVNL